MTASTQIATDGLRAQFVKHLSPNRAESDYEITEVEGEIPRELFGTLFRNGPSQNQLPPEGAFFVFLNPKIENNHGGPGRAIAILP